VRKMLIIDQTPPSLNTIAQTNWHRWYREKRAWQTILESYLMASNTKRGLYSGCTVHGSLRFPTRRRRDEGNFRSLLEKALGDALVNGRWIPDDTFSHYRFGRLSFEDEVGPNRTSILLDFVEVIDGASQSPAADEG
jgi:hypothetical protein